MSQAGFDGDFDARVLALREEVTAHAYYEISEGACGPGCAPGDLCPAGRSRVSRRSWVCRRRRLCKKVRQAEAELGLRPGVPTSEEREQIKELRRENAELRRANEILRAASLFLRASSTRAGRSDRVYRSEAR